MAARYLVTWSLVNSPNGSFYQGREVTAAELGADEDRIAHLLALGAIEPVAAGGETPPAAPPAPPPALAPESAKSGTGDGAGGGDDAGGAGAAGLVLTDPLAEAVGDAKVAAALRGAGFWSPESIRDASDEDLRKVEGVGAGRLARLRVYATAALAGAAPPTPTAEITTTATE